MFVWSTTNFPNPTQDLSNDFDSSVISTQMESGRNRQRGRFTTGFRSIPVNWELTDEQYGLFQGVLKYKLSNGADWFEISLPMGDGFETVTARFKKGKFDGRYVPVMHWRVRATLEVEMDSPLSEAEVDALLA